MITVEQLARYVKATFTYESTTVDMGLIDESEAYDLAKGLLEAVHTLLDYADEREATALVATAMDVLEQP